LLEPLWSAEVEIAADAAARDLCFQAHGNEDGAQQAPPVTAPDAEKLLWLGVRTTPLGFELTCREYDAYVLRWGPVIRRSVVQRAFLEESCFQLLVDTVTPLALITPLPENEAQVALTFKASGLPRQIDEDPFVAAGEAYLPLLRRLDRSGKLQDDGVAPVSWTYLTTVEPAENGWLADVYSGIRRPFGIRRGQIETVAIALRRPPGPAEVRFHARTDKEQSLAGYEVFRDAATGKPELIGLTDRDGVIAIPPEGNKPISMVLLRSEGRVLAKVPVPAGRGPLIDTPIADSAARLQAQSEAQVIREQLIDVVARRAIMMARVRSYLKNDRVDDARKLMLELDSLPTSTSFARALDALEKRLPETEDPVVTRSIERLFTSTRELLGKFLDRRPLLELQTQVNEAQPGGS
ncbi:MAG TPA: hypothetical protein VF175_15070, partial [Lacipirellula sp.]